jgi:hypothetical protein
MLRRVDPAHDFGDRKVGLLAVVPVLSSCAARCRLGATGLAPAEPRRVFRGAAGNSVVNSNVIRICLADGQGGSAPVVPGGGTGCSTRRQEQDPCDRQHCQRLSHQSCPSMVCCSVETVYAYHPNTGRIIMHRRYYTQLRPHAGIIIGKGVAWLRGR